MCLSIIIYIYRLEFKGDKATPSLNKAIYIDASYLL